MEKIPKLIFKLLFWIIQEMPQIYNNLNIWKLVYI